MIIYYKYNDKQIPNLTVPVFIIFLSQNGYQFET